MSEGLINPVVRQEHAAIQSVPPPLGFEPLHRRLARANKEHAKLTQELRDLRTEWAAKNIKAQQTRIAISTAEITHVEKRRRELHSALEAAQREIGACNKEIKATKAAGNRAKPGGEAQLERSRTRREASPLKEHAEFSVYFALAAREQLTPELFSQIERAAKVDALPRA